MSGSSSSVTYWLQLGSPLTVGADGMGLPVWGWTHQHSPRCPCRDILHWNRNIFITFTHISCSWTLEPVGITCLRLYCPLLSQLGMCRAYRSSRGPLLSLKGILDIRSRTWSSSCWHWVLKGASTTKIFHIFSSNRVCPSHHARLQNRPFCLLFRFYC